MPKGVQAFCTKKCLDAKRYRPGKSPKKKMSKSVRNEVLGRDRRMCAHCGKSQRKFKSENGPGPEYDFLHVHHVLYRSEGGQNVVENLITLCHECHALVHSSKRLWQHVLLSYVDDITATGKRGNLALLYKTLNEEDEDVPDGSRPDVS